MPTRALVVPLTTLLALTSLAIPAVAQSPRPVAKTIAVGAQVTLARPTDLDEVLLRLVGVQCKVAAKLTRNADGTWDGQLDCGSVSIKGKRLAIDAPGLADVGPAPSRPALPATDPRIESGEVTIVAIGPGDLFIKREAELVGKACRVTKPLTRGASGYYAGELTCGNNRYYFAEVSVVRGPVDVLVGVGSLPPPGPPGRPQVGERWRIRDAGDVYPSINTTDCLAWPSPDAKLRGGESYWGGWDPKSGDVGVVLGVARHCSQEVDVVFLEIGNVVVAIGAQGLERAP